MSGAIKLSQDIATLINNRQGSDVQFKVGGGDTSHDESATMTLYAHSLILRCRSRYFAAMLDEEKNWKESSNGVIYKPNISPSIFQDVLHYIYTGDIRAKASENIVELIAAADEMNLEELSAGCQDELIRTVKYVFSDDDNDDEDENSGKTSEGSAEHRIPLDVAIRTHIIPALNLASSYSLPHLSQKLFTILLPNISVIIKSPDAYTTFVNNISSESLVEFIASDNLSMTERSVWDLVLSWACHQSDLSKTAVEARLSNLDDDEEEESSDGAVITAAHLNQLKKILAPFLPVIRFSLLNPDDYAHMTDTLSYFLPRLRYSELNRYFLSTNHTEQLDTPRMESLVITGPSKIIVNSTTWKLLRKSIFEAGGIIACPSFKDLKFDLLFRASEHGFLASTFHERCDNKGPTLVVAKSVDGHLFGGVNFGHWKSDDTYSTSPLNFLFTLPDGHHRENMLTFKNSNPRFSTCNVLSHGPVFGYPSDLIIVDSANSNQKSHSRLPCCYNGSGNGNEVSRTTLAGTEYFTLSDYEVFAISKKRLLCVCGNMY